ncbi:MAG: Gldg family protein [Spirochaetales bacterium]
MRRFFALVGKEGRALLVSPIASVSVALFLAFSAGWFFFVSDFFERNVASLRDYFSVMPFVLVVIVSALTMRSWAAEREQGTAELLESAPLPNGGIIFAKYLAVLIVVLAMLLLSMLVPWSVVVLGSFDGGVIAAQYIGIFVLAAAMTAIGILLSVASSTQLSAFLFSTLVLALLMLVDQVGSGVESAGLRALLGTVSFARSFYGFSRGIIDTRDLIYLFSIVVVSLLIAVFLLVRRRGKRQAYARYLLGLLIVLLVFANSRFFYLRLDLTDDQQYTLARVSTEVLESADNPIRLTYYVSPRLDAEFFQPRAIEDALREYEARSRSRVEVRVVDPGELEPERIRELALLPQQIQITEAGEQTIATVYSGITIDYLDRTERVPLIFDPASVEYEVTSRLLTLLTENRRAVGFLAGSFARPLEEQLRFANAMSSTYDVHEIAPGEPIPDTLQAVVVTDASSLGPFDLSRVSDYISRGGSALLTVEVAMVDIESNLQTTPVSGVPVRLLLARYGLEVGEQLVLDRNNNQIPVQESTEEFSVNRLYPYPHWVKIRESTTSPDHPITARFTGLDLYWPTWLDVTEDAPDGTEIIAATSVGAWLMPEPFVTTPTSGALAPVAETAGQFGVVATYSGPERPGRLVVVSDAGVFWDPLIESTGSEHNVEFGLNALQWLTNDEELLELRTRGRRRVALDAIDDPQRVASIQSFAIAFNLVVVPVIVLAAGFVVLARRYRRSLRTEG